MREVTRMPTVSSPFRAQVAQRAPHTATLYLEYVPDALCVELKSLKLYVWSFRDDGAFHEAVTNRILGDLVAATSPRTTAPPRCRPSATGMSTPRSPMRPNRTLFCGPPRSPRGQWLKPLWHLLELASELQCQRSGRWLPG